MGKRKIRKDRVAILIGLFIAILVAIYYIGVLIVSLVSSLINGKDDADEVTPGIEEVKTLCKSDSIMADNIDKVVHSQYFVDTANMALSVYDIDTKTYVYRRNATKSLPPASCMKIPTAITAINTLGLSHRYNEYLLVRGEMHRDTLVGTLLFKADLNPMFSDFKPLIEQMRRRGVRHIRGNVIVSLARIDTLRPHPTARLWDIPYHKMQVLLKGEKKVYNTLMASLAAQKVTVKKDKEVNSALAKGHMGGGKYHYIAHTSTSIRDIITPMLIHSSNIFAEALFYHIDWKMGLLPERRMNWNRTHYVETYIRKYLSEYINGDTLVFRDGSGLSPENRLTADLLVAMLRKAYNEPAMRDYFINEAMASPANGARTGSLVHRMARAEYKDKLYCKTGTLVTIGCSSLSGYLSGGDGHQYIFSIINTDTPIYSARQFQDQVCKAMMKEPNPSR